MRSGNKIRKLGAPLWAKVETQLRRTISKHDIPVASLFVMANHPRDFGLAIRHQALNFVLQHPMDRVPAVIHG